MSGTVQRTISRPAAAAGAAGSESVRAWRAIERAFDRVFQAAENPWRHLGALAFFFFWIVAASGIYLYVFFDTSVEGAFRSVEQVTNEQRVAGGVMRSLHRYASDAFVVAVVLHLLKELVAGRYAGFRWFSWVSGVPLLWLLLASGIGGYWLVWDRLAQFVAVATAEWFDALPLFGEPLIRNFLAPASVSNRFFTLLIFLHIGIPLALLAGMFIHTQRLNYADVFPARALGWGTFAALLLLSLVRPALSQGAADLAVAPEAIAFDWFYLAFYPLIYAWSAEAVWMLAGTVTLGLLLLPFIARGAPTRVARVNLANCNGCARCFADCPYAAIEMQPRRGARPGRRQPVVRAELCAGCGICTGACPSSTPFRSNEWLATGIDMPQQPINALRSQLEAALRGRPRLVAFGCDQGADVRLLAAPVAAAFSLICSGMLPPAFVEYALRAGARGVIVTGCRAGDCAFRLGDAWIEERFTGRREPHLRPSVPRERLLVAWFDRGEEAKLARAAQAFATRLAEQPLPVLQLPRRLRRAGEARS